MSLIVRKMVKTGFLIWSNTNQAVQSQKMNRGLKFWIYEEEELNYPSSENKGADQVRSYPEADLRLCFRICKKSGFLMRRLKCLKISISLMRIN